MAKAKNDKIPESLFNKGSEMSRITGLPRTKMYGIFSEGISMPDDVKVKRLPKTKDLEVTAVWKRTWRMKL